MSQIFQLDPADLALLLAMAPGERIGAIIRLNHLGRYAQRLNAVEILAQLAESNERRSVRRSMAAQGSPDSSVRHPDSSGSSNQQALAER